MSGFFFTFAALLNAQMAELVDALVSNTSNCKVVPVRPRLWVHNRRQKAEGKRQK